MRFKDVECCSKKMLPHGHAKKERHLLSFTFNGSIPKGYSQIKSQVVRYL
jgi:hypothetical protein